MRRRRRQQTTDLRPQTVDRRLQTKGWKKSSVIRPERDEGRERRREEGGQESGRGSRRLRRAVPRTEDDDLKGLLRRDAYRSTARPLPGPKRRRGGSHQSPVIDQPAGRGGAGHGP